MLKDKIRKISTYVQKPGRYTGGELGSIEKNIEDMTEINEIQESISKYEDKQHIATIKGVNNEFIHTSDFSVVYYAALNRAIPSPTTSDNPRPKYRQ